MFQGFFYYINDFLYGLFAWSHICLSIIFFLMANHLINVSQKFEIGQENLKLRMKKLDIKCKYGVFILGLLSVLSLFSIFQIILSFCFSIFPYSPFISIIDILHISEDSFGTGNILFISLATATVSYLALISSILGLYYAIFKKFIQGKKTKGFFSFIGFFILAFFFGLPLMLSYINPIL